MANEFKNAVHRAVNSPAGKITGGVAATGLGVGEFAWGAAHMVGAVSGGHKLSGKIVHGAIAGTLATAGKRNVRAGTSQVRKGIQAWHSGPSMDKGQPASKRGNPNDSAFKRGLRTSAAGQKIPYNG